MKIVIDMPEDTIKAIKDGNGDDYNIPLWLCYSIANGTPLPEGHGRLIDADKLTENILCRTFGLRSVDIEKAQTIIEADKENKK